MTLPLLFAFSFVVGFGAVVTPGPVSTAIVSESARRGFIVGPLVATGHSLTELIMVLLLAMGLNAGLNTPLISTVIAILGGLLLLWMGAFMVYRAWIGKLALPKPDHKTRLLSNWQLIGLGVGATVVNPFWYGWWITVAASYILLSQGLGWTGVLVFFLGHISADYLWDSVLSGIVGRGRAWISDRFYKWLMIACGLYLIYLGVVFVWTPFSS